MNFFLLCYLEGGWDGGCEFWLFVREMNILMILTYANNSNFVSLTLIVKISKNLHSAKMYPCEGVSIWIHCTEHRSNTWTTKTPCNSQLSSLKQGKLLQITNKQLGGGEVIDLNFCTICNIPELVFTVTTSTCLHYNKHLFTLTSPSLSSLVYDSIFPKPISDWNKSINNKHIYNQ